MERFEGGGQIFRREARPGIFDFKSQIGNRARAAGHAQTHSHLTASSMPDGVLEQMFQHLAEAARVGRYLDR